MKKPGNLINPMLAVHQQSMAIWMAKPKVNRELSIKSGD